jgi:hypothetical protein
MTAVNNNHAAPVRLGEAARETVEVATGCCEASSSYHKIHSPIPNVGQALTPQPFNGPKRFIRYTTQPPAVYLATTPRDQQILDLYTVAHLTVREIGVRVGLSGAGVSKILRRWGVPREAGTWVRSTCVQCGAAIEIERAQFRRHPDRRFCSFDCNWAFRECHKFVNSRQGLRVARRVVEQHFALRPEHVVHHHDHDQTNNAVENLAVFATAAEHMSFHHKTPGVQPVWDGRRA